MPEDLFPHQSFPIRLEYKDDDGLRICWFQHISHLEKHISRYGLDISSSKIDFKSGYPLDIQKYLKDNKIKDKKTKKLFSNLETFFNGKGSKRKTKTNSKKSQTPS